MPYADKIKARECSRNWYLRNREKILAKQKAKRNDPDFLEYEREYREKHKEHYNKWRRNWVKNNPEKIKQYWAKTINNTGYREYKREYDREYLERNRDKIITKNIKWSKNNPDKVKIAQSYQNAMRRSNYKEGDRLDINGITEIYEQQNGLCYYCHNELNEYEIDHLIPLSKNGKHKLYNIVLACQQCNRRKYNKIPDVFLAQSINKYDTPVMGS